MTSVFAESYLRYHPGSTVYICLVDRPHPRVDYDNYPFEVILAEDLEIPAFFNFAFKYDILELNTAVKPFVFKYLRNQKGLDRAFYFDPDILVHDQLKGLEEALDSHQAVLTPHLTKPIDNICRPPERVIGMCGIYNLGFAGLRLDEKTESFLDWWCDRLYRYCINDLTNGMFVDQSWMDFAPAYLESVAIMRDPVYNIAYWNLPNRHPENVGDHWEVEGRRVAFFHFSGVDPRDLEAVSKHQDRFNLYDRPELRPCFKNYADLVEASDHHEMRDIPYFYHHFRGTNIPIPRFLRTALMEIDPEGRRWVDPFDVEGEDSYLAWLLNVHPCDSSILHPAALYLWHARPDLQAAFPGLPDAGVEAYLDWYLGGGAEQAGLHRVFVEGLARARAEHRSPGLRDEMERFRSIDLSHPKDEEMRWLNESAGEFSGGFELNRCALFLHRIRPDLVAAYPELDIEGRRGLIYWLCRYGPEVLGIDKRLLGPLFPQLPLKSRVRLRLQGFGLGSQAFELSSEDPLVERLDEGQEEYENFASGKPIFSGGVNILGYFEGERGGRSPARALLEGFEKAGVPVLGVSLDHELPDLMVSELIRYSAGVPYQVSLLCDSPERWPEIVRNLPLGLRLGHRIVGYSLREVSTVPAPALQAVDLLLLPAEELIDARIELPQDVLPIPRIEAVRKRHPDFGFPPGKSVLIAEGDWSLSEDRRSLSFLIDWVRRLSSELSEDILLCLLTGSSGRSLKSEVAHLPIEVISSPLGAGLRRILVRESRAVIDLDHEKGFSFLLAEAVWESVPVICREGRGMGGVLDRDSAWILPGKASDEGGGGGDLLALVRELSESPLEEIRRKTSLARRRAEESWNIRVSGHLWEDSAL